MFNWALIKKYFNYILAVWENPWFRAKSIYCMNLIRFVNILVIILIL